MAPLILHNVPDDELYIGDDGVQRPYAMVFPQQDGLPGSTRSRRTVTETGSFGKSTRRSRSRTGTPARRENPTLAAADRVFGDWISSQASAPASTTTTPQRKSTLTATISQPNLLQDDTTTAPRLIKSEPEEVILRGYRSSAQQYAAINHYEELAGRICEDYSREPPVEQRRYKSDLRDPALTRRKALTAEERAKVSRADGGEHWVKVTFESAEAADTAMFASPQRILGHWVYCEPYHGMPPTKDEAVPDVESLEEQSRSRSVPAGGHTPRGSRKTRTASALPASNTTPAFPSWGRLADLSPPSSHASSQTISSGTLATGSSVTVTATPAATGSEAAPLVQDSIFCQRIPTARKAKLLPADQALLPQLSYTQRVLNKVPFLKWFSGSMIGNEVPRTEMGDFDWNKASLYWKVIWWLDSTFGLFGGEILSADKDD